MPSCVIAVKRLMKEAREMKDATELFHAQPLEVGAFCKFDVFKFVFMLVMM